MRKTVNNSRQLGARRDTWLTALLIALLLSNSETVFGKDDGQTPESTKSVSQSQAVGCFLAPGMITLLEDEITAGLTRRQIESRFAQFVNYAAATLDKSANGHSSSELSGNCRLNWYEKLYRDPLKATAEAEQFTRKLHRAVLAGHTDLGCVLDMAAEKLDLKAEPTSPPAPPVSPEEALSKVKEALVAAKTAHLGALAPLTPAERNELQRGLYPMLTEQNRVGHTLADRAGGRRLTDLLQKMDRGSMYAAARRLVSLTDVRLLEQLRNFSQEGEIAVKGVSGTIVRRVTTPAGDIVVGGNGKNVYDLDKMAGVCAVIDLGGDDEYQEGTVAIERPLLVLIDLAGNDTYVATKPGVQGGAVLGVSMLLDLAGNDTYRACDVAQGSSVGGIGILVDYAGDDVYAGYRRVQGQAVGGIGILIDRKGDDRYHAAMWGQGFGGPLGFGLLDDVAGNDHYYLGGLYPNSFKPETPGYEGWGQGVGAGLRQVANGGIGVLLEGGGDDCYEYDYLAHGGGYWFGVGMVRDFGGNDRRRGTQQAFDGGRRGEPPYQRYACGWGCHFAHGFCFDDAGNDTYGGTIMGLGFAWDMSVGVLCDFSGNDRYEAPQQNNQGCGAQGGLGILFDYEGDDVYPGPGQGFAASSISYHSPSMCGGNFSFLVDYGGYDHYGCGVENDSYSQRGSGGGFVIDRPKRDEARRQAANPPAAGRREQKHGWQ
jgi:hypothetical protein